MEFIEMLVNPKNNTKRFTFRLDDNYFLVAKFWYERPVAETDWPMTFKLWKGDYDKTKSFWSTTSVVSDVDSVRLRFVIDQMMSMLEHALPYLPIEEKAMLGIPKDVQLKDALDFVNGFEMAAPYAEERQSRKDYTRTDVDWLKEEIEELIEAVDQGVPLNIAKELGDVIYVTAFILSKKMKTSMIKALSYAIGAMGAKWKQPRF